MAGQDKDALPTAPCGEEVLEAFVAEELLCVGAGRARHAAEIGHLPAEIAIERAQDAFALAEGHGFGVIGECEREVAQADAAEPSDEVPRQEADAGTGGAGNGARKPLE